MIRVLLCHWSGTHSFKTEVMIGMIVDLFEMKQYLRVDFGDDDDFLEQTLNSAEQLCAGVARLPLEEFEKQPVAKIAVMYAVAYLYEHREDADYHTLMMSLRSLLFDLREGGF